MSSSKAEAEPAYNNFRLFGYTGSPFFWWCAIFVPCSLFNIVLAFRMYRRMPSLLHLIFPTMTCGFIVSLWFGGPLLPLAYYWPIYLLFVVLVREGRIKLCWRCECVDEAIGNAKARAEANVALPMNWTSPNKGAAVALVAQNVGSAVQALLDGTWSSVQTRDRPRSSRIASRLEVVEVLHNENKKLWRSYCRLRWRLSEACKDNALFVQHDARTAEAAAEHQDAADLMGQLQILHTTNEFLLFHGTKLSAATAICKHGFNMRLAGTHKGTLYGKGFYFAEACSKADEYSSCEQPDDEVYTMLVCRVACGVCWYTSQSRPSVLHVSMEATPRKRYHSVIGDRQIAHGTYREFVVYNSRQIYPEFLIRYKRVFADSTEVIV